MVRVGDFEFSLTELAGALGDFGPLNPFLIGYVAFLGLDPFGIFFAMGLSNLVFGLVYRLPLPVEAKKAIGTVALEDRWSASQVYLSGLFTGVIWLFLSFTKLVKRFARVTPVCVIRGVQLGLLLILLKGSLEFMWTDVLLAVVCVVIVLLLLKNKIFPGGLAIFALGLAIVFWFNRDLPLKVGFHLPRLFLPQVADVSIALVSVVIAQLVLTFSNAVLATHLAVKERFPKSWLTEDNLAMNMGCMNTAFSFFGGAPMCHGAGGFAAQYFFGARTGGAMVMEGVIELGLAFLLADSIASVFGVFPLAVIGAMLFFACVELGKPLLKIRKPVEVVIIMIIGVVSFFTNLAVGFFLGVVMYYLVRKVWHERRFR